MYPKPAKLLTVSITIESSPQKKALIDRGSQLNLISRRLATKQGLIVKPLPNFLAECANRSKISIQSITTADITITDSQGHKETHQVPFIVTDLQRYQVYLSLP
jgi:hypothetical protein